MSRVWIGDWLRAWRNLGTSSSSDGEALARMLGLREELPATDPIIEEESPLPEDSRESRDEASTHSDEHESLSPELPPVAPSRKRELVLDGPAHSNVPPMTWTVDGVLPAKSRRLPERDFEPLFERRVTRLLLAAIASATHPEGEIMLREAVDLLAQRKRIDRLPRRLVSTLRSGLVLVVVRNELEPFSDDLVDLIEQLVRVVGIDAVSEWWIDARGRVPIDHHRSWPPPTGTPVLFVVAPALLETIDEDVRVLAARSCPAVALVPGRPQRPFGMSRHVAVVGWDHRTRVHEVVRARQRAERR